MTDCGQISTKEMIKWLQNDVMVCYSGEDEEQEKFAAIIKSLQHYDTLVEIIDTCYLGIIKAYTMLRLGEMRDEDD